MKCDICGDENATHRTDKLIVFFHKDHKIFMCDSCYDGWLGEERNNIINFITKED